MIPNDHRYTNLTVDDTLLVRRKLVVSELELNILRAFINIISPKATIDDLKATDINSGNVSTSILNSGNVSTAALEITANSDKTNVLYVPTPSLIGAGMLTQFTTDQRTQITPIAASQITGNVLNYLFLDASDGDQKISAPTILTRDMYYDTLTVDAGGVIDPGGFVIYCKTALINNGKFLVSGGNGANAAGPIGGTGGSASVSNGEMYAGVLGGQGGNNLSGGGAASTSISNFGGIGGTGGNSNTNVGGPSNPGFAWFNTDTLLKNASFFALLQGNQQAAGLGGVPGLGGGGGAGGTTQGGGGGGGGGGWITIVARKISGTGTFEAKGGNGGAGGLVDGGGGGGGGGGVVYFLAQQNSIVSSQVLVQGGFGGVGGFAAGQVGLNGKYQVNLV